MFITFRVKEDTDIKGTDIKGTGLTDLLTKQ